MYNLFSHMFWHIPQWPRSDHTTHIFTPHMNKLCCAERSVNTILHATHSGTSE